MAQLSLFAPKRKKALKKKARKKFAATAKQLQAAKKRGGILLKKAAGQRGASNTRADGKRKALPPGKRLSRTGKVYYESRKNRSDKRPSRKR